MDVHHIKNGINRYWSIAMSADHESSRHQQPPQIPTGPPPVEHWVASPDRPPQSPGSSRWSSNKTPRTNLRRQNYGGKWIGLRDKLQETHHMSWENPWFPADFPLSQSIECWKRIFSSKWRDWLGIAYSNQKNSGFNHEFWPRMEPSAPHLLWHFRSLVSFTAEQRSAAGFATAHLASKTWIEQIPDFRKRNMNIPLWTTVSRQLSCTSTASLHLGIVPKLSNIFWWARSGTQKKTCTILYPVFFPL